MIITCPHCQTRYQVTYEAIGAAGRKVQCATCSQAWRQVPLAPRDPAGVMDEDLFKDEPAGPEIEAQLDAILAAEEAKVAGQRQRVRALIDPKTEKPASTDGEKSSDPRTVADGHEPATGNGMDAGHARRQRDFVKRRKLLDRDQPLERLRRMVRAGVVMILSGMVLIGIFGRDAIVTQFPAMAGLYEAIGAGVNVVGLEFGDVTSATSTRDERQFLSVKADIIGVSRRPVVVPPVVVTLLDENGGPLYQWSVNAPSQTLMAGETVAIETQLASPPAAAKAVRLSFAGGQSDVGAPAPTVEGTN